MSRGDAPGPSGQAADLAVFALAVLRPDEEIDVPRAALLLAEPEYPDLDIPGYIARLDEMGATAKRKLARTAAGVPPMAPIVRYLYEELGFRGNVEDYYDPRNSFLNEVIDRRTGIPITLGLVLVEVARRAGVAARGVSFPGHFLVRAPADRRPPPGHEDEEMIIDPFDGKLLDEGDLRGLYARVTGDDETGLDGALLAPASSRQVLVRMLANLRGIYEQRGDPSRLRAVVERLAILAPGAESRRLLDDLDDSGPPPPPGRPLN